MRHRRPKGYELAARTLAEWLRIGRAKGAKGWQIVQLFRQVYGRLPSGAMRRAAEKLIGPKRKR